MCSDSNLERCRCLDPHRVTLWCHAQATPPLFLFSFSISMKESNTAGSSLLFLDYTVQLKHSQCTHTYPYECKSANPISMSIFEEWVSKSSRLTKSSQMPRCWWKRHLPLIAQMLLNSRIFASIGSQTEDMQWICWQHIAWISCIIRFLCGFLNLADRINILIGYTVVHVVRRPHPRTSWILSPRRLIITCLYTSGFAT